jgi:ParB-like chromosome segregation protein Spo0J
MAEIIYRDINDIFSLDKNPRLIKEDDFERLCESIRNNPEHFEARPLILSDRTGKPVIIAGNMRFRAAKEIGLQSVPTILLSGLTAAKEKEIIVRDNVSNGQWDFEILANEFEATDLMNWGIDLSKFDISLPGMTEDEPKSNKKVCPHCGKPV